VYPEHVSIVARVMAEEDVSDVPPIAVVGFPEVPAPSAEVTRSTVQQTRDAIAAGAKEIHQGIILVSDLHHAVDWEEVAVNLLEESEQVQAMLHVLDLHELRKTVAASETPIQFIARLMRRFETMKRRKTANLRIEFHVPTAA
jgi:deoxyribose-phosphate aldolase